MNKLSWWDRLLGISIPDEIPEGTYPEPDGMNRRRFMQLIPTGAAVVLSPLEIKALPKTDSLLTFAIDKSGKYCYITIDEYIHEYSLTTLCAKTLERPRLPPSL